MNRPARVYIDMEKFLNNAPVEQESVENTSQSQPTVGPNTQSQISPAPQPLGLW